MVRYSFFFSSSFCPLIPLPHLSQVATRGIKGWRCWLQLWQSIRDCSSSRFEGGSEECYASCVRAHLVLDRDGRAGLQSFPAFRESLHHSELSEGTMREKETKRERERETQIERRGEREEEGNEERKC